MRTRIVTTALALLTALSFATPAFADRDDWHHDREWREHHWREHEWREHHWRYDHPYGYYAPPPPVVYTPPPPPPVAPSLNFVIPLGR